ncbi:MAG: dehydratase [Rhodobiaceae bacterium]|nr:dehydratase [Rhodobiaceae bacterium]MCC0050539.1 dehydratase [Rhodobiaceae bacterium]MCC0061278.1 dehydratase [Rhodobiaceae bacterium]
MTTPQVHLEGLSVDLGRHIFTSDSIVGFAKRYDFQPFHLSEDAARKMHFGALSASGWHTAAIFCAMLNQALPAHPELSGLKLGPWKAIHNLRWAKPARAGDELTFRAVFGEVGTADSVPGWQTVKLHGEGINQDADVAYTLDAELLVSGLPAEA